MTEALDIPPHRRTKGIFITRGARVTIPPGGLRMFPAGESSVTLHLSLSMCPLWLELALDHLASAQRCHSEAIEAWYGTDDDVLGGALIAECKGGMQAIHAAATAVDAMYAALKQELVDPVALATNPQRRRTARYKSVAEVLRRSFKVHPRKAVGLRRAIKHLYRYRDWAAHPPQQAQQPLGHPLFNFETEWRFVAFGYLSARALTRVGLTIAAQAGVSGTPANSRVARFCRELNELLSPTIGRWEAAYPDDPPLVPIPRQ